MPGIGTFTMETPYGWNQQRAESAAGHSSLRARCPASWEHPGAGHIGAAITQPGAGFPGRNRWQTYCFLSWTRF